MVCTLLCLAGIRERKKQQQQQKKNTIVEKIQQKKFFSVFSLSKLFHSYEQEHDSLL